MSPGAEEVSIMYANLVVAHARLQLPDSTCWAATLQKLCDSFWGLIGVHAGWCENKVWKLRIALCTDTWVRANRGRSRGKPLGACNRTRKGTSPIWQIMPNYRLPNNLNLSLCNYPTCLERHVYTFPPQLRDERFTYLSKETCLWGKALLRTS